MYTPLKIEQNFRLSQHRTVPLLLRIELAKLQTKNATKPIRSVLTTAEALSKLGTIPQVVEQKPVIDKVLTEEFWESADIFELERSVKHFVTLSRLLRKKSKKCTSQTSKIKS